MFNSKWIANGLKTYIRLCTQMCVTHSHNESTNEIAISHRKCALPISFAHSHIVNSTVRPKKNQMGGFGTLFHFKCGYFVRRRCVFFSFSCSSFSILQKTKMIMKMDWLLGKYLHNGENSFRSRSIIANRIVRIARRSLLNDTFPTT